MGGLLELLGKKLASKRNQQNDTPTLRGFRKSGEVWQMHWNWHLVQLWNMSRIAASPEWIVSWFFSVKSEARSAVDGKFGPYVAKCSVCVFCKVWKSTAQRCGSFFAFVGHLAYIPSEPVIDHWRRTECIMATVRPLSGGFCPALIIFGWGLFQSQAPDEVIEDIIKALKVRCTWKDQQISNDAKSLEL